MINPLVSIIVPTYNRAYCIGRTIDSVLSQSYDNYEIVIVDDGSSDSTDKYLEEKYGNENRIHYIYQENKGVSAARNLGLSEAKGSYIALLDSDDVWKPWKLEAQVAVLNSFPEVGMVWTDMEAIGKDGKVFQKRYLRTMYDAYKWYKNSDLFYESHSLSDCMSDLPPNIRDANLYIGDIYSKMIMGNLVHTSTVLIRNTRLEKVKKFNEELKYSGEDYDFHLRTCREGPVAYLDVSSIQYQREMEDRLTRPEFQIHMALNFLTTIENAFSRDRDRISLPNDMLNNLMLDTHQWIGEAALNSGDSTLARRHLLKCIGYKLWQPRTLVLWMLAMLPRSLTIRIRKIYAALKKVLLSSSPRSS